MSLVRVSQQLSSEPSAVIMLVAVGYVGALTYLLYTSCPLLIALLLALPWALAIGLPVMVLAGIISTITD